MLSSSEIPIKGNDKTSVLTKLTLFAKLPPELRDRIWESFEYSPNIIYIHTAIPKTTWNQLRKRGMGFAVSYRIPALLHTCQASRAIALKNYEVAYAQHLGFGQPGFYINFSCDALLFEGEWDVRKFFETQEPEDRLRTILSCCNLTSVLEKEYQRMGSPERVIYLRGFEALLALQSTTKQTHSREIGFRQMIPRSRRHFGVQIPGRHIISAKSMKKGLEHLEVTIATLDDGKKVEFIELTWEESKLYLDMPGVNLPKAGKASPRPPPAPKPLKPTKALIRSSSRLKALFKKF